MMEVILIDDEPLAIRHFEKIIESFNEIKVIGTFLDPLSGLEAIHKNAPDIVFIDIEMPSISGIELAEQILEKYPDMPIVFVTAYNQYAIRAFELNAVDYLLKPVQVNRLQMTIDRIKNAQVDDSKQVSSEENMICSFGSLQFKLDGKLTHGTWRTTKAKELFAYLLQNRHTYVRKDVLLELFWPDSDWEKGHAQLYSTIYQIRKTIKTLSLNLEIQNSDHSYRLKLNNVKLDTMIWESGLKNLTSVTDASIEEYMKLLDLYQGDYLAEEGYLWAEGDRERFRTLWLYYVKEVVYYLIDNEKSPEALKLCQRLHSLHPLHDEGYFMLMRLYASLDEWDSVERQYTKLKKMLKREYNSEPSRIIRSWYQEWKDGLGETV